MHAHMYVRTIEPKRMFHGNDLNAQRNFCGSGHLNAQRVFRGNGDLKVVEAQRKCDLVKLGRLQQDLVKLVLLRWRDTYTIHTPYTKYFPSGLPWVVNLLGWCSQEPRLRRNCVPRTVAGNIRTAGGPW